MKRIKQSIIFSFLFLMAFSAFSQATDSFEIRIEGRAINPDSCLTNQLNWRTFEILVPTEFEGETYSISAILNEEQKEFDTIEDFNDFDFKFWLLSLEAFQNGESLIIQINDETDESLFIQIICLNYQDADSSGRGGGSEPDYVKLPIYFATDRNLVETDDLNERFGNERSDLKYGIVQVSIPHDHKIGQIESPSIWRFEFTEDPSKHIMMHKIDMYNREAFFASLSESIRLTQNQRSFLFVHGYNTSFDEAAKRTAQISYDLLFDGKAVFYSWPSQASTLKYAKDEANIQWSQTNIRNFLEDYLTKSGADEVYLVAHSMGNRGMTRAIIDLIEDRPELRNKIKEIILAAPDIDADVFKRDIAPKLVSLVQKPITLYVSSDDLALRASKELHGNPRAGDSGSKMVIVDGVETIDASGVDTSFLSHSYFADTSSIIADIFDMIKSGKRAVNRKTLQLMKLSNDIYYKVRQ